MRLENGKLVAIIIGTLFTGMSTSVWYWVHRADQTMDKLGDKIDMLSGAISQMHSLSDRVSSLERKMESRDADFQSIKAGQKEILQAVTQKP